MLQNMELKVREEVINLLGWPTDVIAVDSAADDGDPHTVLIFVPGNPGCVGWYTNIFVDLIRSLGDGFAARGTSHASHSTDGTLVTSGNVHDSDNRDSSIAWSVDGQIEHKICFVDHVLSEIESTQRKKKSRSNNTRPSPRIIFLAHSIGAHMVERLLMLRPDILCRTIGVVHLMPFIRMKSFPSTQKVLDFGGANPQVLVGVASSIMRVLRLLPESTVDSFAKSSFEDADGRHIAVQIARQPTFAKNFFNLGTEELRDVPEVIDYSSLRTIGRCCPIKMLYCGEDQWGPESHVDDLREVLSRGMIPQNNISIAYMPDLRHDFVSSDRMVLKTVDWCLKSIQECIRKDRVPHSRL